MKSRKSWIIAITAIGTVTAGTAAFVTNFEALSGRVTDYLKAREYLHKLKPPYPRLLDENAIASWNIGTLELATYQIRGYLGQLK